jgi:hypothetical protein
LQLHDLAPGRLDEVGKLIGGKVDMGRDLARRTGLIEHGDGGLELFQGRREQRSSSFGVRIHRVTF